MSQPSSTATANDAAGVDGANECAAAFVDSLLKHDTNIQHTNISNEESVAPIDADVNAEMADATPIENAAAAVAVESEIPPTDQVETTVPLTEQQEPIASQQLSVNDKTSIESVQAESLELAISPADANADAPAVAAATTEEKEEPEVEQPSSPSFSASDSASESGISRSSSSMSHSSRSASYADHDPAHAQPFSPSISADSSSQSAMEEVQSVQRSDSASSSGSSASAEESKLQLPSQASSVLSQPQPAFHGNAPTAAADRATSTVCSQQLNHSDSCMVENRSSSSSQIPPTADVLDDEADLPATQPQPSHDDAASATSASARTPLFGPTLRVDATFNRTFSGRSFAPEAPFLPVKPLQLIKELSVEGADAEADAESEVEAAAAADTTMAEQQVPQVQEAQDAPQAELKQDAGIQSQENIAASAAVASSSEKMEDVATMDPFTSATVSRSASTAEFQFHDRLVSREPSRAASSFNPFENQEPQQLLIERDQSVPVEEDKEPTAEIVPLLAQREASNSIADAPVDATTDVILDSGIPVEEQVRDEIDNRLARVESVAMEFTQTVSAPIQLMQQSNSVREPLAEEEMADVVAEDDGQEHIQSQSQPQAIIESIVSQPVELLLKSDEEVEQTERPAPFTVSEHTINQEETSLAQQSPAEEQPIIAEQPVTEEPTVELVPIVEPQANVTAADSFSVSSSIEAKGDQVVCEARIANVEATPAAVTESNDAQPSEVELSNTSAPCDAPFTSTTTDSLSQTQVNSSQKVDEQIIVSQQPVVHQQADELQVATTNMETDADAAKPVSEDVSAELAVEAPMEVLDAAAVDSSTAVETMEAPIVTMETATDANAVAVREDTTPAVDEDVQISEALVTESPASLDAPATDIPAADITPALATSSQTDSTEEPAAILATNGLSTPSVAQVTVSQPDLVDEASVNNIVAEVVEQDVSSDAAVYPEADMEVQAQPESVVAIVEPAVEPSATSEAVVESAAVEPNPSLKEAELAAELDALRLRFDQQATQLKESQSDVAAAREFESTLRSEWSTKQSHFETLIAEFDANQLAASNSFQSQLHTAQAETTRLSAAQQQMTLQLASTQERLKASETSANQSKSEVKSLSTQLASAQDESVKLQSDVGSLMAALESKNAACESHSKELRENAVELQQLRLQATPTQHLIEARDLEIKAKVTELNDKAESIKRLKSRIDELEEEAKSNQLESKKLQKKNATLEATNEELQEQVKALPSIQSQLSSAQCKIQSYETDINQLRDSLKSESTKAEAAEIRSSADRLAAIELEDQSKSLSQRLLNSEKEVNQGESKIAELTTANAELMSKVALLEEKEKAHHASSTAIKNAIETYRAQKSQLMKENKQFTEQVAQLQAQLAKAPSHKVQLDELTKLQAEVQEKHDALEKECASLRKQVSDSSTVKAEKEFEIQALRKSEREQRRKIEASEEKFEEMKERLEAAEKKLNEPRPSSAAAAIPESNSPPIESIQNTSSDASSTSKVSSRRRLQLELTVTQVPESTAAIASKDENTITIPDDVIAQEPTPASKAKDSKDRKEESKESVLVSAAPAATESDNGTSGKKTLRVRGKTNAEKEKEAALQAKAEKEREDKEFAAALAASLAETVPAVPVAASASSDSTVEGEPAAVSTRSSSHGSSDSSESKKSNSRKKQSVKDSITSMEVEQNVTTAAPATAPSESNEIAMASESGKAKPSRKRKSGTDDAEKTKSKEEPSPVDEKPIESAPPASPKLSAKDAFRLRQSKGKIAAATAPVKEDVMDTTTEEQPTTEVHISVASLATPSTKKRNSKSPTIPSAVSEEKGKEKEKEFKEKEKEKELPAEEQKTEPDEVDSSEKEGGSARKKRRTSRAPASRNAEVESDVKLSSIPTPVIMFSGFKPGTVNNLEQLATLTEGAKSLGATIYSGDKCDWSVITHCVAPKGSTTEKALGACLKHKFVCEPEWLLYSIAAGQFLDESSAQGNSYAIEPFKGKTYAILNVDFERKRERVGLATRLVQLGEGTILPFNDEEDSIRLLDAILCEPKANHKNLSSLAQSKLLAFEKFMALIPSYQSKPDSSSSSNASTTGSERKAKRKASEEESKEAPASASSKRTASNGSVKEVTLDKENVSMSSNNIQTSIADLTPATKGGEKKKQRKASSVASEPASNANTHMETEETDKDKKKKNKRSTKNEDDSEEMSASQPKPTTRQARNLRV